MPKNAELDVFDLWNSLNNQFAVAKFVNIDTDNDARACVCDLSLIETIPPRIAAQEGADPLLAPISRFLVQHVNNDLESRSGAELRNSRAHDSAAHETDALHEPNLNMVKVTPAQGPPFGAPIVFQGQVVDDPEMEVLGLETLRYEPQA